MLIGHKHIRVKKEKVWSIELHNQIVESGLIVVLVGQIDIPLYPAIHDKHYCLLKSQKLGIKQAIQDCTLKNGCSTLQTQTPSLFWYLPQDIDYLI